MVYLVNGKKRCNIAHTNRDHFRSPTLLSEHETLNDTNDDS